MALAFRNKSQAQGGPSVTSLIINKPTSTASGDILLGHLMVYYPGSGLTITPPSGWTLLSSGDIWPNNYSRVYYKVAGGSEPSTYTWTFNHGVAVSGDIAAYSGGHASYPINASDVSIDTMSSTSHPTPSISTTATNTMIVTIFGGVGSGVTWTPPSGETERVDQIEPHGVVSQELNDEAKAAIGSTGAKTATTSVNAYGVNHIIALTPASPTYYKTLIDPVLVLYDTCGPVKVATDYYKTLADAIQVSGITMTMLTAVRSLLDTLGIGYLATDDECVMVKTQSQVLTDSVAMVNPAAATILTHCIELLDTLVAADNALFPLWAQLVETVGLAETFIIGFGHVQALTDTVHLSEVLVNSVAREVSDLLALAESLHSSVNRYLTDTTLLVEDYGRTRRITLTDGVGLTDLTAKMSPGKLLTDTIIAIDLIANSLQRLLTDSISSGEAGSGAGLLRGMSDTLTLADTSIKSLRRVLSDLTELFDSIAGPPRPELVLSSSFRTHQVLSSSFRQHLTLTTTVRGGGE